MAVRILTVGLIALSIFLGASKSLADESPEETEAIAGPCLSCRSESEKPALLKVKEEAADIAAQSSCQTIVGEASYYGKGDGFKGKKTASKEKFNPSAMTAAHPSFPFNTLVTVENLKTGKKVKVRINDRGPYAQNRIIDLSYAAARKIGLDRDGVGEVRIQACNEADPGS